MSKGKKVYSPILDKVFTVKEIKGNAIYTEEGAVLSTKLVESCELDDMVHEAVRLYRNSNEPDRRLYPLLPEDMYESQ